MPKDVVKMDFAIFISYRRQDSDAFAGRVHDPLNSIFPEQVFLDVEGIKPGTNFDVEIRRRLRRCKAVIALIGPGWSGTPGARTKLGDPGDYVTLEIQLALEADIPVIPILIGGVSMPARDALPPELRALALRKAVRLSHDDFNRDIEPLTGVLHEHLALIPQTSFERFMESLPFSYGAKWNEKMRDYHAILSAGAGIVLLLVALIPDLPDNSFLFFPLATVYTAWIGKNSRRRRKWALTGLALSLAAFILETVWALRRSLSVR
jgi:hypothetical protein